MLEIVKLKSKNQALVMEVNVPPLCAPLLVGNPKEGGLLTWVEKPSVRGTVLTWGHKTTLGEIIVEMIDMVKERGLREGWENVHVEKEEAISHLLSLGVKEVEEKGGIVFPRDPSLLGSLIISGDKIYPVIHNPYRGLCFIESE